MIQKYTHEEIQSAKPSPEEILRKPRTPLFVVLDNIRSIYNVGAFFRTSDALLVEKMFLCGITGHPPRKDAGDGEFIECCDCLRYCRI